jgi:hypothetical protein
LRWDSAVHDRNTHYLLGLSMALDARRGDVRHFVAELEGARTWPGWLHGLLVAAVLAVGGPDYRLAVLPNLAAWAGTVVVGFLLARRLAPRGGNWAGLIAAGFIAASPAHRVFATDLMLESLGAFLSLLALYLYVVTVQQPRAAWAGHCLGLSLTALFLDKYNYWLLVALSLAAADLASAPREWCAWLSGLLAGVDWRRWAWAQLRHPLTYALALLAVLLAVVLAGRGGTLHIGQGEVALRSPYNLVNLAYGLLFLRVALWWAKGGKAWARGLEPRTRSLVAWHALPVAVYFLLPKRLGYLLWFVSPANTGQTAPEGLASGWIYYLRCLGADYHAASWAMLLTVGLAAAAFLGLRKLRPGGRAVFIFFLVAASLTVLHPQRKSRYVHTWVAAGWVAAGLGFAAVTCGRCARRAGPFRPWLTAAAAAGVLLAHGPALSTAGHSPERGHDHLGGSTCDLADVYLPWVADSRRTAFLSTIEMKYLMRWTCLERFRRPDLIEVDLKGFGPSAEENRRSFERWLASTSCDTLVFIDVPPGSHFYELTRHNEALAAEVPGWLAAQTAFTPVERHVFREYGCTVTRYARRTATVNGAGAQPISPRGS